MAANNQTGAGGIRQFGQFRLHELINSGGMADIWLVTNPRNQAFALRRMHDKLRYNFLAKRRFTRGCEVLSKIHNHQLVIGYFEHGKIDGTPYMLMEYVESSNLKQLYLRNDPLLDNALLQILIDMATALEHVHDSGYMHLDFKPENILVTRNGHVRLVDFDLAQPKPEKPKKQWKYPGTPAYMSPEQLLRKPIDHRADIWAFGVAAYELLTRRRPFPGETGEEVLRKQVDRNYTLTPPRSYNEHITPGLEKLVLKCLERDPDKRYPWLSVVVRDLKLAA
jgi:serine/threonine protein kinase